MRGLKWHGDVFVSAVQKSHLTRGAWIEIYYVVNFSMFGFSRTAHEVRGVKFKLRFNNQLLFEGRTSHEVRGLKFPPVRSS